MKPALTTLFKNAYLKPLHSRLCDSQNAELREGMRNLFLSGWVRDRGMSGILSHKEATLVLSTECSAKIKGMQSCWGEPPVAYSNQSATHS